ncbi:UNVERIFIED_CONTAM: hypothetical protein FKN15_006317 [Acipenser sinensis]
MNSGVAMKYGNDSSSDMSEPAEGAVPRGLLISNDNTAPRENTRSGKQQMRAHLQPAEGAVPRGLLISNDNTAPRENTRSGVWRTA